MFEYNFFINGYERATSRSIPETLLPNIYVFGSENQSANLDGTTETPSSLYRVAAVLLQFNLIDLDDLYVHLLSLPSRQIDGGVYNAGYQNLSVLTIAELVKTYVLHQKLRDPCQIAKPMVQKAGRNNVC